MQGEQNNAAIEPDDPTIDQQQLSEPEDVNAEADAKIAEQGDSQEGEQSQDGDGAEGEELEVIEYEGEQYEVPKPLKDAVMRQSDYTRKMQQIAEDRKGLATIANNLRQSSQISEQETQARAHLANIDAQLKHYGQTDWNAIQQEDPLAVTGHMARWQQLKDERERTQGVLNQMHSQRTQAFQHDVATRLGQTQEYARQNIKGWSPDMDKQIVDFAKSKGITEVELASLLDPRGYEILHLARIGAQAMQNKTAPRKSANGGAKPTRTVGGKSNPSAGKNLADMSMEEYAAHREKQMKAEG